MTDRARTSSGLGMLKRYSILAYGTLGTMGDIGLMVLGSLLVGLSVAVLFEGLGLVDVFVEELTTGATMISAIVLAVVGLFCLGVASEGPLGRGRRLIGFEFWEIGIGRIVAAFVVGLLGLFAYDLITGLLEEVPSPVAKGVAGLRAVSVAGMTVMPLIGVPLSLIIRATPEPYRWVRETDIPVLFLVWAAGSMIILT